MNSHSHPLVHLLFVWLTVSFAQLGRPPYVFVSPNLGALCMTVSSNSGALCTTVSPNSSVHCMTVAFVHNLRHLCSASGSPIMRAHPHALHQPQNYLRTSPPRLACPSSNDPSPTRLHVMYTHRTLCGGAQANPPTRPQCIRPPT